MTALFSPVLSLGPFIFEGVEEPSALTFGKVQSTYKHILIGGGRVIDLMGAGDPDITWRGYFIGAQAEYRARYMDSLVKAGQPLLLKCGDIIKQVTIKEFTWGFRNVYPIVYTITVEVVQDLTLPVNFQIPPDLTDTILAAIEQAQDIATLIADPSVSSSIALALIAARQAAPFASASAAAINNAISTTQAASNVCGAAITTIENNLFPKG